MSQPVIRGVGPYLWPGIRTQKNNNNKLCKGAKISGNVISLIAPKGIHNYMTNAYNKAITLRQSHNPIWVKKKKNKKPVEEEEEVLKKKEIKKGPIDLGGEVLG